MNAIITIIISKSVSIITGVWSRGPAASRSTRGIPFLRCTCIFKLSVIYFLSTYLPFHCVFFRVSSQFFRLRRKVPTFRCHAMQFSQSFFSAVRRMLEMVHRVQIRYQLPFAVVWAGCEIQVRSLDEEIDCLVVTDVTVVTIYSQ